jgi:hypothetical protein
MLKLSKQFEGREHKNQPFTTIVIKGDKDNNIYIVARGNYFESINKEETKIDKNKELIQVHRPQGSVCCMQNLLPSYAEQQLTTLYTQE